MNIRFVSIILLSLFLTAFCPNLFAQKDSIRVSTIGSDSSKHFAKPKHSPSKALLFSAVLPGLGQAYNHKYWKIPIIYAGLGTMAYFIISNNKQYNNFKNAIAVAAMPANNGIDPAYPAYSITDLTSARDYYHRYRDLSVIGAAVFYVLNLVDAEVDAQLFSFNVSDDISMHITPTINTFSTGYAVGYAPSLSLSLKLK